MEIKKDYIRVTELLKPWQDWGNIPKDVLEAKAEIGTNVHDAIAMHAMGLPIPILTERESRYFDSYLKWEEYENPTYICTEQRYYDEDLMLTGQVDAIVSFPGRPEGRILDFKTSSKALPLHWPIQLGWYYMLCLKNNVHISETAMMLQLKDNGSPAKSYVYPLTHGILGVCKSLYESYIYFNPQIIANHNHESSWCC
tara:strand:- start:1003 stop:1596 length:594 start_codon:yes stop_codon:yes gene_type:complete